MDPSSIITQVKQESDGDTVNSVQPEIGGTPPAPPPEPDLIKTSAAATHNDSAENNHIKNSNEKGPKKKHKLFHSLLCCFGRHIKQRGDGAGSGTKGASKKKGGGGGAAGDGGVAPDAGAQAQPSEEKALLAELRSEDANKKCLVIDLDETLVHSSFKPINNADFIVPVEIDGNIHQVYVLKRPFVDEFLMKVGELYECVLFTASLAKYADPVTDLLDKWDVFRARLFRESCVFHRGNYVKDLGRLGRELNKIIIVDNSPASYIFHPENAVPVVSWFDDMENRELLELIPFFEELSQADNIYNVLRTLQKNDSQNSTQLQQQQQRV